MKIQGVFCALATLTVASDLGGTVVDNNPLVVIYMENWAAWVRNYGPSVLENKILSRNMPARNIVVNYAFLAWNPTECSLVPTDTVDVCKQDPSGSPPADWNVGTTTEDWYMSQPPAGILAAAVSIKSRYPYIKLIPSVGGWSRSGPYHNCMATKQDHMIQSIIDWVTVYGFDGVDFDWEYPNCENSNCGCQNEAVCLSETGLSNQAGAGDWDNYKAFISKLRTKFNQVEQTLGRKLYISAAVGMNPKIIDGGNDVWQEAMPVEWFCAEDTFDYVNLMAYDFYGPWAAKTGPLAPLYSNDNITLDDPQMSIDDSVSRILARCDRPYKLLLGLPTYGKTWKSVPKTGDVPGLWQDSTASTYLGPGTWEDGTISYWDISNYLLTSSDCTRTWDDVSKTPTLYCTSVPANAKATELNQGAAPSDRSGTNVFVSYDDAESWAVKMSYAREKGLAGAIIWAASDLGDYSNKNEVSAELLVGLFRGWTGDDSLELDDAKDTYKFPSEATKWEHYPCPIPGQNYMKSGTESVDISSCPDVGDAAYSKKDSGYSHYGYTVKAVSDLGKDKILIHAYDGSESGDDDTSTTQAAVTKTATTKGTTTTKEAVTKTATTKGTTTTKEAVTETATTKDTTASEDVDYGECSIVETCASSIDGTIAKYAELCVKLCEYYMSKLSTLCEGVTTGAGLKQCIVEREPGLCQ